MRKVEKTRKFFGTTFSSIYILNFEKINIGIINIFDFSISRKFLKNRKC